MTLSLRPWFHPTSFFSPDPFSTFDTEPDSSNADPEGQQVASRSPANFFHRHSLPAGPATDIHDTGDTIVVTSELPGVKKEDVHVSLDDKSRKLTISGSFKSEFHTGSGEQFKEASEEGKENGSASKEQKRHGPRPLISERTYGSFSRTWILPNNVQTDHPDIKASFQDGVLKLCIPKKAQPETKEPRTIMVE
ncbi:HSP20-like chaperone [Tilletiaria anomala UBC 951]|uniref:HSP20-like chaperone n=1 Tax=Tilletiaria anomala (strain ATCC 24038 / CBS 436.72 / UBC 951) TaxID=1037660 RepID=A0A066WP47_TILAU|nr:HSP20-like chaperone [Tilletiaria anomala UBC 951]KDN52365.1 HSP20-like chaperone [Tilletiaria anomala UBC 951]